MTRLAALVSVALLTTPSLALAGGANEVVEEGEPVVITEERGSTFSLPLYPGSLGGGAVAAALITLPLLAVASSSSGSH